MSEPRPARVRVKFFSPGTLVLMAAAAVGLSFGLARLLNGLGAVTNLDDFYPWGIWIAIDVACGVALAAGGFTTAALVDVFGRRRFKPLLRPAILTAWLGYFLVAVGLMFDLGRIGTSGGRLSTGRATPSFSKSVCASWPTLAF
jgi:Ni/Fe-hydrogenase subunit HybB-like protein